MDEADNCGTATILQNIPANVNFGTAQGDAISVMIGAKDDSGNFNTNSCTISLTLNDNQAPSFSCPSSRMVAINPTTCLGVVPNLLAEIIDETDNCSTPTLSQSILPGTSFGPNEGFQVSVTITADDGNGNTTDCSVTLSIDEDEPPVAICQNITAQLNEIGIATVSAQSVDNGSNDECGIGNFNLNISSFGCGQIGNNPVILTVTDLTGNTATCNATITVEDMIAPTMICQNVTIQLDVNGNGSTSADMINNGSNDACGITSMTLNQTNFDCSNIGANTVTLTATDNNGNTSSCNATVTVMDQKSPDAICQNVTVPLDAAGNGSLITSMVDNNSSDACGIASLVLSQMNFDCSEVGNNTVTLTVTDNNDNVSTCTANVTVTDPVAPFPRCRDIQLPLDADGNASISVGDIDKGSTDACGIASISLNKSNFDCSNLGDNLVLLIVSDNNHNSAICTANVEVIDNIAPTAVCLNTTVTLQSDGTYTLQESDVFDEINSSDNCPDGSVLGGITQIDFPATVFSCAEKDMTLPIQVTVRDASNNTSSCDANITVAEGAALPDTWNPVDIGNVTMGNGYAYAACEGDGQFYVTGSGNNAMGTNADNVAFSYQTLCGDGSITAKLESISPNGYGGLMIRESADVGSKQVSIFSDLSNIYRHEARYAANIPKQVSSFFKPAVSWLRLERQGDWIFAYYSMDGINFQYLHGVFLTMQNCVEIGLASFTYLPNAQTEAVFSNVFIDGNNSSSIDNDATIPSQHPNSQTGRMTTSQHHNITLWPNPATNFFQLKAAQELESDLTLELYNAQGQRLEQRVMQTNSMHQEWPVEHLKPGTYFLKTTQAGSPIKVLPLLIVR